MTEQEELVPMPEAPKELPPVEEAAMKFTKLLPYIYKLATAMPSKGGVVRVMTAMAAFPLGAGKPKFLSEQERQLFVVLNELQGYKATVLQDFVQKQMELEKQTKAATELPVTEKKEE